MSTDELVKLMAAITAFLGAATAFYLTVVKPLLAQVKELIGALRDNTEATNVSAAAISNASPSPVTVINQPVAPPPTGDPAP